MLSYDTADTQTLSEQWKICELHDQIGAKQSDHHQSDRILFPWMEWIAFFECGNANF